MSEAVTPIVLFAYARPDHLRRVLQCLRTDGVPLICAFSDAPAAADKAAAVAEVRRILRAVDWCRVELVERETNLGLGRSILDGVGRAFREHEQIIVFEDDIICVPGAYGWLRAALERYRDDPRVMSVTGWTHESVTPSDVAGRPYFDGRAECLVWGTWRRAWDGMEKDARTLMRECEARGIAPCAYGADLPAMAEEEQRRNIWAVRFLYLHMLKGGLCLRPPRSLVEHIGYDSLATNAQQNRQWVTRGGLGPCPPIPESWPEPVLNPQCQRLWQRVFGGGDAAGRPQAPGSVRDRGRGQEEDVTFRDAVKFLLPPALVWAIRRMKRRRPPPAPPRPSAQPELELIPEGWAYAAGNPQVRGWNAAGVLETYKRKWPKFAGMVAENGPLGFSHESELTTDSDIGSHNAHMAFAYVLALAARGKSRLSMLDWGGGIGHYYLLARALVPDVVLEYCCKDVPLLAGHGRTLFPDQRFCSDDSCLARRYDLVFASASLHYSEDWRSALASLGKAADGYLYITRLPVVTQAPSFVFIQRPYAYGYGTEYLGWCLNRGEFLAEAGRAGLALVREFAIGECPPIAGATEQCRYRGYLFRPGKAIGPGGL